MSDIAIKADSLSKHYRLGAASHQHNTLRDHLMHRLRGLTRWGGVPPESNPSFWALKDVSFEVAGEIVIAVLDFIVPVPPVTQLLVSEVHHPVAGLTFLGCSLEWQKK